MERYENGVLRQWWDIPNTRYHEYDATGAEVLPSRLFTPEETSRFNTAASTASTALTQQANADAIGSKLSTVDMPAMQAILDQTNAALQADPSQEIKDIAKAVRRLTRKVEKLLDGVA